RVNSPARGYYFVPGGRILKDETINDAFLRLSLTELGISIPKDLWNFHGVYEHFYEDNKYNKLFSTHYIVLAYETILTDKINFPTNQHSKYKWVLESLVGKDERIHNYTKNYFPA
ncbi:NUDIX domain-containing protein, partial [Klebsiella pneumoniae]